MSKDYKSPTTPGLDIDFKNYIIELVCLNMNKNLKPKFWRNDKYWTGKYKREIKGVSNLMSSFESQINKDTKIILLDQPLAKKILIQTIKKLNIKSLSAKKTVDKIVLTTKKAYIAEVSQRSNKVQVENPEIDFNKNALFVDGSKKNKLSRIRDMEG